MQLRRLYIWLFLNNDSKYNNNMYFLLLEFYNNVSASDCLVQSCISGCPFYLSMRKTDSVGPKAAFSIRWYIFLSEDQNKAKFFVFSSSQKQHQRNNNFLSASSLSILCFLSPLSLSAWLIPTSPGKYHCFNLYYQLTITK